MHKDHCIAVVVPAHNEEALVDRVIIGMPAFVDHIIVVDDASEDRTAAVARAVPDPRARVVTLTENLGVGGAVMAGHKLALGLGADISVVMAGDDQMDPAYLEELIDPICDGRVLFTKANRFFAPDSFRGMPRSRVVGNIAFSFLTKASSGYWNLFDPQNGYTAIHRSALERVPFERISTRYDFENDLLINLNILRTRACDVPVPARYGTERSGIKMPRVAARILWRLFRGFWHRITWKYVMQSFSPVAVMLFAGLGLVVFGTAVGVFVIVNTLGPPAASAGTVVLCVAPLLTGIQLLTFSWLLDIQESLR